MVARPTLIIDAIKVALINRILGPKDFFERQKKRLLRRAFILLSVVFAGPAIILSVLANVDRLEVKYHGAIIKFVGRASDDSMIFAVTLVVVYAFALFANLYYAVHVRDSLKDLEELRKEASGS